MKKCLAPLLALTLVCMQCNDKPQPPTPAKGIQATVGGKTIEVRALTRYEERRRALFDHGDFAKGTGLLLAHARDRYIHLYGSPKTFRVDFIDTTGKIVDTQMLVPGERGITSEREARYALITHPDTVTAAKGDAVSFSETVQGAELPTMRINGVSIYVDIAPNADLRSRGLMYRPRMSKSDGMIFCYPSADSRSFWMGKTFLPLSLAYIRSDGTISQFHDMEPYPDPENPPQDYKAWPSKEEVQYVLEVNWGFFKDHQIREGMKVEFPPELREYSPR